MGNISLLMEKKHVTGQYRTNFKDNCSFIMKRVVITHRKK